MKETLFSRSIIFSLVVTAVIFGVISWLLPHDSFWITDGGNKFILIRNLAQTGSTNIVYPAADIDPEGTFFPDGGFHFQRVNGGFQSFYPPYFPWLCAQLFKFGGAAAVFALSLISGLVCIWLSLGIAKTMRLAVPVPLLTATTAFATPLLFYSLVLWEHTFSIVFAAAALLLILKVRFFSVSTKAIYWYIAAGLLLAVSSFFREESYILFGAVGLALLLMRTPLRSLAALGVSWALAMLPLWWYQYHVYGHVLGSHALGYQALSQKIHVSGVWEQIFLKITNLYVFLFKFQAGAPPPDLTGALLIIPLVLLALVSLLLPEKKFKFMMTAMLLPLCAGCVLILTVMLFRNDDPIINTLFTQGLLTAVPLLTVLLAGARQLWKEQPVFRFILLTWAIFTLTVCVFLNQGELGLIWGPRHFLVLMPLLMPLAVYALIRLKDAGRGSLGQVVFIAAVGMFALATAIQIHGVVTLYRKKQASSQVVEAIKKNPDPVIVTDIFWLGEDCGAIFFEKKILQIDSDHELQRLILKLREKGVETFTLVLSSQPLYRSLTNDAVSWLLTKVDPVSQQQIVSPRAGFMGVIITRCHIKAEGK